MELKKYYLQYLLIRAFLNVVFFCLSGSSFISMSSGIFEFLIKNPINKKSPHSLAKARLEFQFKIRTQNFKNICFIFARTAGHTCFYIVVHTLWETYFFNVELPTQSFLYAIKSDNWSLLKKKNLHKHTVPCT